MSRIYRAIALGSLALGLSLPASALADEGDAHVRDEPAAEAPAEGVHGAVEARGQGHGEAHAGGHEEQHAPTFDDINWFFGFLGEKEGVEPSLMWRPKGMPVPFGALAFNCLILYFLLFKFGKKPIGDALRQRKLAIMKGIEDAAKMKADAEARLAEYQTKLDDVDQEVARIRREMKEAGEAERVRILSEAMERRARMERDARTLVEQELKAARVALVRDTVRAAIKSAEATLTAKVGDSDQQRLGEEYLGSIKASGAALRGRL
jgi:F-type H+-transporting ATPase subunit b